MCRRQEYQKAFLCPTFMVKKIRLSQISSLYSEENVFQISFYLEQKEIEMYGTVHFRKLEYFW
jgi:hypothetical protein